MLIKRTLTIWLLFASLCSAQAQDVQESFGLVQEQQSQADENRVKLQAQLNSGAPTYPWFFPGSASSHHPYFFDTTVELPSDSGRAWVGPGGLQRAYSAEASRGAALCMRAVSFGTRFNGTTKVATAQLNSPTVLVLPSGSTGRIVVPEDQYNSFEITGGTNFIPGWYGIESVDTVANTWTLDRACVEIGNGSAMTGFYCPALIRNHGVGTYHRGLWFTGKRLSADAERGQVGYQVAPNQISGSIPSGKHIFENCTFSDFDTAILCGRNMARAYAEADTWSGDSNNHADQLRTDKMRFEKCRTCFFYRNEQSVNHVHTATRVTSLNGQVFYAEAGGKISSTGLDVSGGGTGTVQRILRLGNQVDSARSPYTIRDFSFDSATSNPQLIKTDSHLGTDQWRAAVTVVFDTGHVTGALNEVPLVDIAGPINLLLKNIQTIPTDSIVLKVGTGGVASSRPNIVFDGCRLGVATNPEEVIDEANCDPGIVVKFRNCASTNGMVFLPDKDYLTGSNELTIASGVVTALVDYHRVDTQSNVSTDDLDTINGGKNGMRLTLRAADSGRSVVLKDGTGNLRLSGDRTLDNVEDTIELRSDGTNWFETSMTDNGAFNFQHNWKRVKDGELAGGHQLAT